ncbi:MAG: ribbon-helix-helix domain-containing protein [Candidatus Methanogranum gryphiswaldense]|nr:MAG: ribbon-helix-helix domain-containing protein [Candidatus Methanogranum sp. U3.2.1]
MEGKKNGGLKVISAKVPVRTYDELEKTAAALEINKNELINRAVRLYLMSCSQAIEAVKPINTRKL